LRSKIDLVARADWKRRNKFTDASRLPKVFDELKLSYGLFTFGFSLEAQAN
jgi:hypothetical protein